MNIAISDSGNAQVFIALEGKGNLEGSGPTCALVREATETVDRIVGSCDLSGDFDAVLTANLEIQDCN